MRDDQSTRQGESIARKVFFLRAFNHRFVVSRQIILCIIDNIFTDRTSTRIVETLKNQLILPPPPSPPPPPPHSFNTVSKCYDQLWHCLHGRGFICNRIGFDAVTPFVYTAPVEFVIRTGSFSIRFQKWSVFKTIRFQWSCKR